jgi:hypothetical protein
VLMLVVGLELCLLRPYLHPLSYSISVLIIN